LQALLDLPGLVDSRAKLGLVETPVSLESKVYVARKVRGDPLDSQEIVDHVARLVLLVNPDVRELVAPTAMRDSLERMDSLERLGTLDRREELDLLDRQVCQTISQTLFCI